LLSYCSIAIYHCFHSSHCNSIYSFTVLRNLHYHCLIVFYCNFIITVSISSHCNVFHYCLIVHWALLSLFSYCLYCNLLLLRNYWSHCNFIITVSLSYCNLSHCASSVLLWLIITVNCPIVIPISLLFHCNFISFTVVLLKLIYH
jgi:hypothetical protein